MFATLKGTLDGSTAEAIIKRLQLEALSPPRHLLIDMTGVEHVTATGLRGLLPFVQQIQRQKKMLLLCGLNKAIEALVNNSGFDSLVKVLDSPETAELYLKNN